MYIHIYGNLSSRRVTSETHRETARDVTSRPRALSIDSDNAAPLTTMRPCPETSICAPMPSPFLLTTTREARPSSSDAATQAAAWSHGGVETSAVSPISGSASADHADASPHSVHQALADAHLGVALQSRTEGD